MWRTGMCCIRGWTDTTRSGTYESNAAAKWRDTRVPYICGGGSQRGEGTRTANMSALTGFTLVNSKLKRHSHWCLTRKP